MKSNFKTLAFRWFMYYLHVLFLNNIRSFKQHVHNYTKLDEYRFKNALFQVKLEDLYDN